MTDWGKFKEELEARLEDIPKPVILTAKPQFHSTVNALTDALQDII
jgi:hypothetical protein